LIAGGKTMNHEITLRKADFEDINIVVSIFKNAIEVMDKNDIPQWDDKYPNVEILNEDIVKGNMFLGEIDNQIASVFVLNQECDEQYKNGAWNYKEDSFAVIHRLCVNPLFQNKGVAAKSMNLIEEVLKAEGIETIRLDAFSLNPIALKLYEKLGYIKVGEANWRKGLFYLYEKKI
jgi:ribosomal protein S18 acetylase RimI-like enzyme